MSAPNFTQQSQLDCQWISREHQRQREESLEGRRRYLFTEPLDHGRDKRGYQRRREDSHEERRSYLFMEFYSHDWIPLENWQKYEFSKLSTLMKERIIDRRMELEWGLTPYVPSRVASGAAEAYSHGRGYCHIKYISKGTAK